MVDFFLYFYPLPYSFPFSCVLVSNLKMLLKIASRSAFCGVPHIFSNRPIWNLPIIEACAPADINQGWSFAFVFCEESVLCICEKEGDVSSRGKPRGWEDDMEM